MLGVFVYELPHESRVGFLAKDIVQECCGINVFEFFVVAFVYSNDFVEGDSFLARLGHICAAIGCGSLLCVVYAVCADSIDCASMNLQGISRSAACLPNAL